MLLINNNIKNHGWDRTMQNFDVEISLPTRENFSAVETFQSDDVHFILSKFYNINWRRQLLNQLQLEQAESYFALSNATTGQYIQISLNALSTRAEPEFNIDSNIELITQSKEFLGLFTRTKKQDVIYKNLIQVQVSEQLSLFVNGEIQAMTEQYQELMHKRMMQQYRIA